MATIPTKIYSSLILSYMYTRKSITFHKKEEKKKKKGVPIECTFFTVLF